LGCTKCDGWGLKLCKALINNYLPPPPFKIAK
jgi:hypothetical protein